MSEKMAGIASSEEPGCQRPDDDDGDDDDEE